MNAQFARMFSSFNLQMFSSQPSVFQQVPDERTNMVPSLVKTKLDDLRSKNKAAEIEKKRQKDNLNISHAKMKAKPKEDALEERLTLIEERLTALEKRPVCCHFRMPPPPDAFPFFVLPPLYAPLIKYDNPRDPSPPHPPPLSAIRNLIVDISCAIADRLPEIEAFDREIEVEDLNSQNELIDYNCEVFEPAQEDDLFNKKGVDKVAPLKGGGQKATPRFQR
jgi:hypothetical protein